MDILIQIVSLVTTLIGLYLVGEKKKSGFMFYNVSLLCQIYLFIPAYIIIVQLLVLLFFNFYNFKKWKKGESK